MLINNKSLPKVHLQVAGMFVGCGGLDYGFKNAGFDVVWANEIDKDAALSYKELIGHDVVVDDIWNVLHDIPKVDVIIGGPPCQSFSLVGKRLEEDPRGRLVFAFAQAIKRVKPKAFVMENVPGLTASYIEGKRLHEYLAEQFVSLGYNILIKKLAADDFFVPQRRKRLFMIGYKNGLGEPQLPNATELARLLGEPTIEIPVTVSSALDDLPSPLPKGSVESVDYISKPKTAYTNIMRRGGSKSVTHQIMPTMSKLDREFVRHIPPGGNYQNIPDNVSTRRILSFKASGGRTTTYGRLHPDYPSYTINTYFNRPNVGANYHHREERLITVREAFRLQSFPDFFSPVYSSQRSLHKQVGNAVPPLMGVSIALAVRGMFNGRTSKRS